MSWRSLLGLEVPKIHKPVHEPRTDFREDEMRKGAGMLRAAQANFAASNRLVMDRAVRSEKSSLDVKELLEGLLEGKAGDASTDLP